MMTGSSSGAATRNNTPERAGNGDSGKTDNGSVIILRDAMVVTSNGYVVLGQSRHTGDIYMYSSVWDHLSCSGGVWESKGTYLKI